MTFVLHSCYILGWFEWCLSGGMLHWRRTRGVLGVFEGCLRDFCVSGGGECCLCIDKGCRGGFQVCFWGLCVLFLF
nr:MAG TPA: hypothetical protein [Caudoviricetes sp.]